jgi:predicted site-specific integrase-resolvase
VYCRVSSHEQKAKGDLDRQVQVAVEHCESSGLGTPAVYTDVGSGLNARRGGLKRLCRAIEQGRVRRVFITYKDRLTRFGFEYLQRYFASHGASIGVIRQAATRSMHEELVDDLVAIVTSFSGRVHGLRGHRRRRKFGTEVVAGIIAGVVKREIRKEVDAATRLATRA